MPKWGLTQEQIESQPWGLSRKLLKAEKTITNSVQGDVYLNRLERLALDSPPLQRLRRVKQLGNTHLVYPDATHVRLSHILGALRVSQDLLDAVLDQENRPEPQPDLFAHWRQTLAREEHTRKVAEVIVLTRLGALLHDMCHVPFGHTVEDDLGLLVRHDGNVERFQNLWDSMVPEFRDAISDDLLAELQPLILSKSIATPGWRSQYPFVEDLVGNTICADLLDYLPRDHRNMGLPYALGHRFIEGLFVTAPDHPHKQERVAIEIYRHGQKRADVESELIKALRYRYEESERALMHHAKLSPDAMIGKLLAMWRDALWVETAERGFVSLDAEIRKDIDAVRAWIEVQGAEVLDQAAERLGVPTGSSAELIAVIDTEAKAQLEAAFVRHGDDGLLERLILESERPPAEAADIDSRRAAIGAIAQAVLDRRDYKSLAWSQPLDRDVAESLWDQYGGPDNRRRLEMEAAQYVGLEDKWHLVLWIPSPDMKLKLAEVLVGNSERVTSLHEHSSRVREIYDMHRDLWALGVFVHPDLRRDELRCDILREWLRKRLGLTGWVDHLGGRTVEQIAVDRIAQEKDLRSSVKDRLLAGVSGFSDEPHQSLALLMEALGAAYDAIQDVGG